MKYNLHGKTDILRRSGREIVYAKKIFRDEANIGDIGGIKSMMKSCMMDRGYYVSHGSHGGHSWSWGS